MNTLLKSSLAICSFISLIALILCWIVFPLGLHLQILITAIIAAVWISYGIYHYWTFYLLPKKAVNKNQPIINEIRQNILIAMRAIKKLGGSKKAFIVLLGPSGAGKTTLLANAGVTLNSPHQQSLNNVHPTKHIDWWISKDVAFIDPSGKYCLSSSAEENENFYWNQFLKLLPRYMKQPLQSVAVAIDFTRLTQTHIPEWENYLHRLTQQIQTMVLLNRNLTITIIVTQCDLIDGFDSFFSDFHIEEKEQVFGFTLKDADNNTPLLDIFNQRFNQFIQKVNSRLFWRLHHEHSVEKRARITDFPFQLEQLSTTLEKLINTFPHSPFIQIQGIYFTSSVQTGKTMNLLTDKVDRALSLPIQNSQYTPNRQQPFFIKDLMHQLITSSAVSTPSTLTFTHNRWFKYVPFPIAGILIIASLSWFHYSYKKNSIAINQITEQLSSIGTKNSWLSRLNALKKTIDRLNKTAGIKQDKTIVSFKDGAMLEKVVKSSYVKLLNNEFLPHLNQILTSQITTDIHDNQIALYNSLQVYLMLVDTRHVDKTIVSYWFSQYWKMQFPHSTAIQNDLLQHLQYILTHNMASLHLNRALVHDAQDILQKRPLADLGYMMLLSETKEDSTPFIDSRQIITGFDTGKATIPDRYSEKHFNDIINNKIPALATTISRGNWVLGSSLTSELTASEKQQLTTKVRTLYSENYIKAWRSALNSITLQTPSDLTDITRQIDQLANPNSTLWKRIHHTADNINPILQRNSVKVSTDFLQVMRLSEQDKSYKDLQTTLNNLKKYLNKIKSTASPIKKAYDIASKRFSANDKKNPITELRAVANALPAPIKQWALQIATNSWKLILINAQQYLNTIWQSSVLPEYDDNIKDKYPIFKKSQDEISPAKFNQFFGPGGTIELFFNYYIRPFVDTTQSYWTWKKVDGISINIPQDTLEMLIRASMIQKMFYSNNLRTASVKFSLTPINLSANVKLFVINIGGQILRYQPGIKKTASLNWPGHDGDFITISFNNLSPIKPTLTKAGPWALLHLFDASHIRPTNDPKTFLITFTIDENEAEYRLIADAAINPFLPDVLSAFRCPDSL